MTVLPFRRRGQTLSISSTRSALRFKKLAHDLPDLMQRLLLDRPDAVAGVVALIRKVLDG